MKNDSKTNKNAKLHIDKIRHSTYISCWTKKEHESRSLWANYMDSSKQGVAIKSTVYDFKESIEWGNYGFSSHIIDYRNEFNIEELQSNIIVLNTKSTAYIEETEVRFTINGVYDIPYKTPEKYSEDLIQYYNSVKTRPKVIEVKIDTHKLINELLISPFCSP